MRQGQEDLHGHGQRQWGTADYEFTLKNPQAKKWKTSAPKANVHAIAETKLAESRPYAFSHVELASEGRLDFVERALEGTVRPEWKARKSPLESHPTRSQHWG